MKSHDGDYRRPGADIADAGELSERIDRHKYFLLVFFLLSTLLGLSTFGVTMWIRFDLDFAEWVTEINWYSYWACNYVIMFTMVGVVLNSLLAMYAAYHELTGLLTVVQILLLVLFLLQLVGAVVICIWGVEESDVLVRELREVFLKLVYKWDEDPRASRILRQIQEYVGCCGAKGSEDFINAHKPVPMECRDRITGVEYRYGCQQQMAWWLEPWTAALAAICCFYCLTDVVAMWAISRMKGAIRTYNQNY